MEIACLILAAGRASRMGQAKQLLSFGEGRLIEHVLGTAQKINFSEIRIVLGAYSDEIRPILKQHAVELSFNPYWETGMGSSIAQGIDDLPQNSTGVLIMLGDQPFVHAKHLQNLIFHFQRTQKSIIASYYKEKLGVPALFDRSFFGRLKELEGKEGAGKLIKNFAEDVHAVPFAEAAIDIDTPEDYRKWKL